MSLVDPTGISNAFLAVHYCSVGDAANCGVNAMALIPLAGVALKDVGKGAKLGAEGLKLLSPQDLAELARPIKNVGDVHPAQLSQQVIAVGTNADGVLVGASNTSSSWTQAQRALADQLGIIRAPSRTVQGDALHAEENMPGLLPDANGVGLSALPPCPDRCHELLGGLGIPWAVSK